MQTSHLDAAAPIAELSPMPEKPPATMRCIQVTTPGVPEVMQIAEMPVPEPKPDELLIRVHAAGVNRPDVQQRKGLYPPPPGASPLLGLEAAGEVAALGAAVTQYKIGDRVTALCNGGAYAQYVTAPATQSLPWPAGFDAVQAAAIPENYFTVWANVFDIGRLRAGESLLVHGGSSGIGICAIQLAVARGATAYATAGSPEKCAVITRLGGIAINYREQDFAPELARLTEKKGVDVILDMVGAPYTVRNIASLAHGGRLVQIAIMEGAKVDGFNIATVMVKRLTVTGSTLRPRSTAEKAAIAASLRREVWPLLDAGKCRPIIHKIFPLTEAASAHQLMESSAHIGKIMLQVA
jgi:NADPH:quinone reductase